MEVLTGAPSVPRQRFEAADPALQLVSLVSLLLDPEQRNRYNP